MFRIALLLLLATISARGQDSVLVAEVCRHVDRWTESDDIEQGASEMIAMIQRYMDRNPELNLSSPQDKRRFSYKLFREVKRACMAELPGSMRSMPNEIIDLEGLFTETQIEKLSNWAEEIRLDKQAYVYIVTIDDFYPDSDITDFSNRYRDHWAPINAPEKGNILVVVSAGNRKMRISTGEVSMNYLTDQESEEVIEVVIPYFKKEDYYNGLIKGLNAIRERL